MCIVCGDWIYFLGPTEMYLSGAIELPWAVSLASVVIAIFVATFI